MCGIAGNIDFNKAASRAIIQSMCDCLTQRGPDAEGIFVDGQVALGHRRLSIIDLETGDQPMFSQDKNKVLVFNGEIYNFLELREQLIAEGYTFKTSSDTEVILIGYEAFGIDGLLEKLEGMFAFALYDIPAQTVFIARDKFGEKPLYYHANDGHFLFASELKALENQLQEKEIDLTALNLFLSLSYIPAPHTIYKGVKKLRAGHYITIPLSGSVVFKQYYNLLARLENQEKITDFDKAKKQLRELLYDSVKKRMIADVPLGSFLSGGVDSSIITAIMSEISDKPVNTFSIGFTDKSYDESERAKLVADKLQSNHTVHFLDYKDVVNVVDDIINYYDEPFGDSSAIPSYYVAKLAREKVTVVLTGDCADELFGGYEKYLASWYTNKLKKFPGPVRSLAKGVVYSIPHTKYTNSILRKVKKVFKNVELTDFELHYSFMCLGFSDSDRASLLLQKNFKEVKNEVKAVFDTYNSEVSLEKGFFTDLNIVLEGDMLTKVDRVCMKNSLEARVPFLDSRIVEFAYNLPLEFKIKGNEKKYILRETFKDLLPPATSNFSKKGFGVPIDLWFKNELKAELENLLNRQTIEKQGIFDYREIEKLVKDHMNGAENNKGKLWNLFVFQKWYNNKMQ